MSDSEHLMYPTHRIMMIDDEASNLQIVKIILMRESFHCDLQLFESGEKALEYLRDNSVDLILLDLAMPGMDGFDVMKQLNSNPATAEIPVIFLSAFQETEYILRAFEMGATDYICKPIISPILTARIRYLIETRGLQNDLRQSNDDLVNTNRLKDELLSVCSHDLRSPLNAIEVICEFLTNAVNGKSDHSPPELINRILSQSRLARRLVENLLDLNRIEEGQLLPNPSFGPVQERLRTYADDEQPTLQARGIGMDVHLPEGELLSFWDQDMIAQVIRNILSNATRYAKTSIRMTGALVDYTPEAGGRFVLEIEDDGCGIDPAQQRTIFDKYAKLDQPASGSGLGLYIARQIVELHGGKITVRSEPERGTTFQVELPHIFMAEQLPDLSAYHQRHVLVASSSRPTVQLLESVLVEGGMLQVHPVLAQASVTDSLAEHPPELIVLDLESEMLGGYLLEHANQRHPAVPWLLIGPQPQAERLQARIAGMCYRIDSPLNPLVYLREVERSFAMPGTRGESVSV